MRILSEMRSVLIQKVKKGEVFVKTVLVVRGVVVAKIHPVL